MNPSTPIFFLFALMIAFLFPACGDSSEGAVEEDFIESTPSGEQQRRVDPAIERVSAQIEATPEDASLYASRAELWYEKSNYDNAILDLQSALTLDEDNLEYHYLLSDVYLNYYQSRLALKTMERAVALDPDNIESQLRLAEVQIILKQYDPALATLNEVTRVEARNPDAYILLGQVFAETGDTARAINATQEAVEIDPDLMDGWITLGRLHAAIGGELAERFFNTAIELDPNDVYAVHAKADFLRDEGQLNEAIKLYRKTSEIDRQYVAGHFNAGLLYLEMDSVAVAERELNIVLKNDPIHIRGYFFRGYARELQGNVEGAREDYATALRFSPDYELALAGMARLGE